MKRDYTTFGYREIRYLYTRLIVLKICQTVIIVHGKIYIKFFHEADHGLTCSKKNSYMNFDSETTFRLG